jgi:hypothetical protein
MEKEDRQPREQTGRELALYLKSHPAKTLAEFSALAKDPAWARTTHCLQAPLPGHGQAAAQGRWRRSGKLRTPGDTTPLVVDEDGSFIARYISERPAENVSFEQARGKLQTGIYEHWRRQHFLDFTNKLEQSHRVEMHPDRLPRDEQRP